MVLNLGSTVVHQFLQKLSSTPKAPELCMLSYQQRQQQMHGRNHCWWHNGGETLHASNASFHRSNEENYHTISWPTHSSKASHDSSPSRPHSRENSTALIISNNWSNLLHRIDLDLLKPSPLCTTKASNGQRQLGLHRGIKPPQVCQIHWSPVEAPRRQHAQGPKATLHPTPEIRRNQTTQTGWRIIQLLEIPESFLKKNSCFFSTVQKKPLPQQAARQRQAPTTPQVEVHTLWLWDSVESAWMRLFHKMRNNPRFQFTQDW